ncbi:Pre-rRNA-processing protein ipi3 [Steccherinum ochraceum]|uniref:Pre-rRNA-processing protein IPI3 n=1 Tax=Steccherinum ochraceum TaxID=92696 RepID=A0A4V2MWU7_9APHY|nr:Pre-rRNA-processing protein ipi3 [Steccherinum ochraceum]
MNLQEIILCATAPITPGTGSIALHDIQTGSTLATFKQTSAQRNCTAVVTSQDGQGGFMLAAQAEKSIMNVYNFQKDQLALKIVLPEKLSCIAVDARGDYCAGGTSQGRIYLWEVGSGIIFHAWDAHYRQVNVLRFTPDSAALLSGSEDASVNVWSMARLLDNTSQNDLMSPYCTLTDHTLPITDISCGVGVFPQIRVLTSSVDHSVKLWDLSSNTLLTTFQFTHTISLVAWDVTERLFFAAADNGLIQQVNLFRQREDKFSRTGMEAVGGAGVTDIIRIDPEQSTKRSISVGQPVTALTLSLTSSLLLAGTIDGHIHVYDVASHQLLRSITTHKGLSITHLRTMLKPPDLVGHVSLSLGAGASADAKDSVPVRPVAAFQRMQDPKAREAHEVARQLPVQLTRSGETFISYSTEEMLRDHAVFIKPDTPSSQDSGVSLHVRVNELETEVAKLRQQLGKAKGINDAMWDAMVRKAVTDEQEKAENDDAEGEVKTDDNESRRKRGP